MIPPFAQRDSSLLVFTAQTPLTYASAGHTLSLSLSGQSFFADFLRRRVLQLPC